MEKRTSPVARLVAALALLGAALAVVVVISSGTGAEDSGNRDGNRGGKVAKQQKPNEKRTTRKTYVVKSGDTLSAIARETGVSVEEIRALNPEVDPLTLIEGQKLKLR